MYIDLLSRFRRLMARVFAVLFFALSTVLVGIAVKALTDGLGGDISLTEAYLRAINMGVVALAMFELGLVVMKEYALETNHDGISMLRRTVPRFVAMVCVALVLEGLLMAIKYSQLELAGNLVYPVAIIASAALLLIGLGVFRRSTEGPGHQRRHAEETAPATVAGQVEAVELPGKLDPAA